MSNEIPIEGFAPIAEACARVLILGSMPSVMSLNLQQYYGHSRNAFWPIMMKLFNGSADTDYEQRKQILLANHIAVWDVLKSCRRNGSLDSGIQNDSLIINDFAAFFARYKRIKCIFFNGAVAEKLYRKYVLGSLEDNWSLLPCSRLPSTSPAHAAMSFREKLQHWRVITEAVYLD